MSEETVGAATSAAEDVFGGLQPTLDEYNSYRKSGELPARFKPAESDSAPDDQDTSESNADAEDDRTASETDETTQEQSKPRPKKLAAEGRIAQLESRIEREWEASEPDLEKIGQWTSTIDKISNGVAEKKRKTEPAPVAPLEAQQVPQQQQGQANNFDEWYGKFDPDQWVDDFAKANPTFSFERVNAAMAKHIGDVRYQFDQIALQRQMFAQQQAVRNEKARERFGEEFESVIKPTFDAILSNPGIPDILKESLAGSALRDDLMLRFAKDTGAKDKFFALVKNDAIGAVKYIGQLELQAEQQNSGKTRNENGQFAPEPKKSMAPKPVSPVGGTSSRSFDVNDESLSADEWKRKRDEQVARQR